MDLSEKQLKTWGEIIPQPNAWISRNNEEKQNSTWKEYGELIALRDEKKRYLNSTNKNLDELLKNQLNHEEPPWRTPVTKDDEIELRDGNYKIKVLRWFRWGFRRNGRGNLNSGKEKMKTLRTRIYSSRKNSEEKD